MAHKILLRLGVDVFMTACVINLSLAENNYRRVSSLEKKGVNSETR